MNKYKFLKYAVIGLTFTSRATSAYATYAQDYRAEIASHFSEQAQQTLIDYGNQVWVQECAQQTLPNFTCQEIEEGVLIN